MSDVSTPHVNLTTEQQQALRQGCQRIAPSWPLDNWIAVNPWWQMRDGSPQDVSARLNILAGARCVMAKSYFLQRWQAQITAEHLDQAIAESELDITVNEAVTYVQNDQPDKRFEAFSRLLDQRRDPQRQISWHDEIIHQISQTVASYAQRMEQSETNGQTLYQYWWEHVIHDRGIGIVMAAPGLTEVFATLPQDPQLLLARTLEDMDIAPLYQADFAHAMLLDINGWASWAAHHQWMKTDVSVDDDMLWQLLAIRMAWEWVLYHYITDQEADQHSQLIYRWHQQFVVLPLLIDHVKQTQKLDWLWQRAAEISYQQNLFSSLHDTPIAAQKAPVLQAVFCIDVRSEVYRRALEAQHPDIETRGFAGFFGLPLSFSPADNAYQRPQLPGLLASTLQLKQTKPARTMVRNLAQAWHAFSSSSISSFNAVEAGGWLYGLKMIKNSWFAGPPSHPVNGSLNKASWQLYKDEQPLTTEDKVELAHSILTAMGLTNTIAPTVILVGHGSQSSNNHLQASLDCGACCGQTGEINVRVLAEILNDPAVRQGLKHRQLRLPDDTRFIAGMHNTTTDELSLPEQGQQLAPTQQRWLKQASETARQERAKRLTIDHTSPDKAIFQRSRDWAQLRPEWGLANNASFIVAERRYTRQCNLQGRSFLHDYNWQTDSDYSVLELILTAPMIVAHWINFQYYASVTDNHLYGSGDKTLHNIVAGHLGVFEGNGGDLRTGLPMQSLHNGKQWMHEPLRLTVVVHAPQDAIGEVVGRHTTVQQLVNNQWLYLYAWQPERGQMQRLLHGKWHDA